MRSPIGWLYCGISVICAIGVKSGVTSGSYQIIEGHSYGYPNGQIFQRVIPSVGIGYRNIGPQIQARRVNAQNYYDRDVYYGQDEERDSGESNDGSEENSREDYNEEHREPHSDQHRIEEEQDQDEEEEEDMIEENSEFNYEIPSNNKNSEEEENEEEEEAEEDDEEEEEEMNQYLYGNGRQANGNIKIQPNATVQAIPKNASTSQKIPTREDRKKNNNKNKNKKKSKPKNSKKKKKPTQLPEEISPIKKTSQYLSKNDETYENHKENLQIRVISDSHTQFVASPIADLILRLSISLAKPIGQGNGTATYIHVPVRVSNNEEKSEDKNSTASSIRDRVETLLQKLTSAAANSRPSKVVTDHPPVTEETPASNQEIDVKKEAGEKIIQV